jgi:hypothetical protein
MVVTFVEIGRYSIMEPLLGHADLTLVGPLVLPTAVLLCSAAVAAVWHRGAARWIAMVIGAAGAAISLVLTVLAATGVIALVVAYRQHESRTATWSQVITRS